MTEEEKKAIESLKNRLEILHNNTQWATENSIKVVLNLIDKQQKEIEEYKYADNFTVDWLEHSKAMHEKYVRKDKIRDKIEEKEKQKEEVPHEMDFRAFYRISDLKEVEIGALKELLEE